MSAMSALLTWVLPAGAYDVGLRIPGWCREWKLEKNGEILSPENRDGYVRLAGSWAEGDQLRLTLEMPVRLVQAHPAVHEDCGRVAVTRGPLVYCMEECDNGKYLKDVRIRRNGTPSFAENPQLGVTEIRLPASRREWPEEDALYAEYSDARRDCTAVFIPYYAWANREEGEMLVWTDIDR